MKKLDKFQAENCKDVKSIDANAMTCFKGGRLSPRSIFGSGNTIEIVGRKPSKYAGRKIFGSFAELKAFMFGGK